MALVSLDTFKDQIEQRGADASHDVKFDLFLRTAEAIVIGYITRPDDDDQAAEIESWDEETAPAPVQAAVLMQAAELWRFRGDDEKGPEREPGSLAPNVVAVLTAAGYRRPVIA